MNNVTEKKVTKLSKNGLHRSLSLNPSFIGYETQNSWKSVSVISNCFPLHDNLRTTPSMSQWLYHYFNQLCEFFQNILFIISLHLSHLICTWPLNWEVQSFYETEEVLVLAKQRLNHSFYTQRLNHSFYMQRVWSLSPISPKFGFYSFWIN